MKFLSLILISFLSSTSFAMVPDWLESTTKNQGLVAFVQAMLNESFYKITDMKSYGVKSDSGQDGWDFNIIFSDAIGCSGRNSIEQCFAPENGPVLCLNTISNCLPHK